MGRDTDFDFGHAAQEILDSHGDVKLCMGRVKCVHCGAIYGVCSELETQLTEQENNKMLPRAPQTQGGGQQRAPRSGYTYISETDLSADKHIARILATKINDGPLKEGQRRFSDMALQVAFRGQTRLFGIKFFDNTGLMTPNYQILIEDFGEDNDKWIGREFYLFAEKEEFSGRIFPRVEPIALAAEKPKPAGRK